MTTLSSIEEEIKKVQLVAENDMKKLELTTKRWGTYYIILVIITTTLSGIGAAMINDLSKFIIEVLPTILISLVLGLVFLRRGDETVRTTTEIVHKSLSGEMIKLHDKMDILMTRTETNARNIEANQSQIKDEDKTQTHG